MCDMHKQIILKYALQNAIRYKGKANIGAVIGKVLAENPDLRNKAEELSKEIRDLKTSLVESKVVIGTEVVLKSLKNKK